MESDYETVPLGTERKKPAAHAEDSPWSGAAVPLQGGADEEERRQRLELVASRDSRCRRGRRLAVLAGFAAFLAAIAGIASLTLGGSTAHVAGKLTALARARRPDAGAAESGQRSRGRSERRHRARQSKRKRHQRKPAPAHEIAAEGVAEAEAGPVDSAPEANLTEEAEAAPSPPASSVEAAEGEFGFEH